MGAMGLEGAFRGLYWAQACGSVALAASCPPCVGAPQSSSPAWDLRYASPVSFSCASFITAATVMNVRKTRPCVFKPLFKKNFKGQDNKDKTYRDLHCCRNTYSLDFHFCWLFQRVLFHWDLQHNVVIPSINTDYISQSTVVHDSSEHIQQLSMLPAVGLLK